LPSYRAQPIGEGFRKQTMNLRLHRLFSAHVLMRALLSVLEFLLTACTVSTPQAAPSLTVVPSMTPARPTPLPILPTRNPTITPRPTGTPKPPTLSPDVTRNPSATPDPLQNAGEVLFAEDFEAETGWGLGADEAGLVGLVGGKLAFTIIQPGLSRLSLWSGPVVKDASYQVTALPIFCASQDEYALLFNVQDSNNYHRFSLTCDGLTQVARVQNGATRPLKDFARAGSVITGAPAENRMGVWSSGGMLRFFVNDVYLYSVRDSTFIGGIGGLYARARGSASMSVGFDDLTVWAVNPQ